MAIATHAPTTMNTSNTSTRKKSTATISAFNLSIYPHGIATIRFRGHVSEALVKQAFADCAARNCRSIAIDVTEMSQAPASALQLLLHQRDALGENGGRLVAINPSGVAAILFDMMGMREQLPYFDTLDAALSELLSQHTRRFEL